jgi:hypothetical protein
MNAAKMFALGSFVILVVATCTSSPPDGARTIHPVTGGLTGYDSGTFCETNGVNRKVECGCPYSPCEDGDPMTRFDYCSADGNSCLPGIWGPAETCDNAVDDDGDALVDAEDPDCQRQSCMNDPCPQDEVCDWDGYCSPHCGNGWQDGDESDLECGGSCGTCSTGQHCWVPSDCASGTCSGNVCT